ncbi:hypothetical protein H6P81_021574 [Aristolochia fimbriata]|uniref:Uncharacterized protein n=1 Tax=Aristolochia fimbriata TaxID=158543 RepID=A0AAV7DS62_ARIFI|nr:hypothetical protein H6P81_021574 [Aristolochia fimbriata]
MTPKGQGRPVRRWGISFIVEGNSPDHQLRPLNDRSVIKEVGVQRQPGGERSALEESTRASRCGRSGSENVGLSNANIGENQCPENLRVPPQGSSTEGESGPKIRPKGVVDGQQGRVRRGRENASSQCPSTRRYGAEVTHAILPGKARTTFNKRVPVPETDTGEPATEAPVNGGRNYNGPKVAKFLVGLGGRRRRPPCGGSEPSVRYHSGRARILTLCQDLRAKGQSQVTEACKRFPRAGRRLALECKGRRELDCKTHPSSRDESRP